ncbi:MAG: tRNA (guanosine(37)-N1)-methyltransferase TrmD [Fusobacteriaceae bacterium]|jgi:tRNA (guanine37-N1)-methyltransferase|nr:tRNA (guanosine(37)-N1)-methyltransferase TrmD [Fusobacteriaceae bacterium]
MRFNVLTLFPGLFEEFRRESIIGRAMEQKLIDIRVINIRDFAWDKHRQADDVPFGGGGGMVMKPEPLLRALATLSGKLIYTSPQGVTFTQKLAGELAKEEEITIIAGHYEGIDERVLERTRPLEISIGDYVLTGGELPAMVIMDAVTRLVDGVIKKESYERDSFYDGLLDFPQYTRPCEYEGQVVPEVLISGHHKNIEWWRLKESLRRTRKKRPDLILRRTFSELEKKLYEEILREEREKADAESKRTEDESDAK